MYQLVITSSRCGARLRPLFLQNRLVFKNYNAAGSFRNNGTVATNTVMESAATATATAASNSNINAIIENISPPPSATLASTVDYIPPPPEIPLEFEPISSALSQSSQIVLNAAGEPTFASIGLGSWYPPGIVQSCLEFLHIDCGLPWWGAIMTGTVIIRLLLFPLVVKSQKNAAKMANNMPQLQVIQAKMSYARQSGDTYLAAKLANDMVTFMKEKEISPFKSMLVPMAMAPVFISVFIGLRKMANLPVESLRDGGLFWFTDLTLADPFYLLPLITSTTLWITLELGADGVKLSTTQQGNLIKYGMRLMPIVVFPLTMNFPAALLCYWVCTNLVSLSQVAVMKIPKVRKALKIPMILKHAPEVLPPNKGFRQSVKESWTNMKITREVQDRERFDELSFKRAGSGPVPRTFKYDPTAAAAARSASSSSTSASIGVNAKQHSRT